MRVAVKGKEVVATGSLNFALIESAKRKAPSKSAGKPAAADDSAAAGEPAVEDAATGEDV